MKTYVLVVDADLDVYSWDISPLTGKRYRSVSALGEAISCVLCTDGWELYSAEDFCEEWNNFRNGRGVPDPSGTYIAIVEVEHDE